MIKHCYYINLEKREDRRNFIESELIKSSLLRNIYKRFSAVDGYQIHPRTLNGDLLTENSIQDILMDTITAWGLSMTQGGLGVLLTYIEIFNLISNHDSASIIFEDDTTILDNFDEKLINVISELPNDFDICYLGYGEQNFEKKPFSKFLSIPTGIVTCLPSIIVSPRGAKKILSLLKNIDNQIDTFLSLKHKFLNVFVVNDKLVKIKNEFLSDIQGNKSCIKHYKKQNFIFATISFGVNANNNALKLANDLKYFKQKILIVTNEPDRFKDLDNVIVSIYPFEYFSYNHKFLCFEEGFKYEDSVVYVDSDSRVFYENYKNCYTNFLRIIKPGFHPSWDWGLLTRNDSGFFNSTDIENRVSGYGELALKLSNELDIPIGDAYHHQEGILIISRENDKEKIFLETWKKLSKDLDEYEIKNGSSRIGVGEGNLIGLSIAKSRLTINTTEIANLIGSDVKYNFYGNFINEYITNYPNRKLIKTSDGKLIKTNNLIVSFKEKEIDLSYSIYETTENTMFLIFDWNKKNNIEFLDHEFKINDIIYHFNSDKTNEIIFEKRENIEIYHTYDWYGEKKWEKIDII